MAKVTAEIQNPLKNQNGYGYKYATLDSILEKVRPVLAKNGLSILQSQEIQESSVVVTTLLMHTSGEWIETRAEAPFTTLKGMNDYQSLGAGITYLRRYAISSLLNIASEEDTDANATSKQEDNYSKPQNNNPQQPQNNGNVDLKALGIKIVRDNDVLVPQELQKGAIFNNKNTLKQLGFKWNSELKRWEKTA
jgi:hypothetical protein